jgi:hypothetical protein
MKAYGTGFRCFVVDADCESTYARLSLEAVRGLARSEHSLRWLVSPFGSGVEL